MMPRTSTFQELFSGLSTEELVKRLKVSCKHLGEYESLEGVNSSELHSLSKSLIQPFLQSHRSGEVKGLVFCCIADIFRVYHPDPPYDEGEIKVIFDGFVNQLRGLEKPSTPAFKYSFQLLETLANIRLFNLCLDMEDQDILTDIFRNLFQVVNSEQSTKVKNYIIDILSALVQDGESLPQEVIDIILSKILPEMTVPGGGEGMEGKKERESNTAVYAFTVEFIRRTSSHIEPYIHLYFNNALVVGKDSESEVAEHLYELIQKLHAIDSSVMLAVMPQLEFKLKSTDIDERFEVTKLLAQMFSPKTSKLAAENRPLWNCFLGRFADVAPHIRIHCIESAKDLLLNHPHLVEDVAMKLHDRFYDKEEKVRTAVVKTVCEVAGEDLDALPKTLCDDLEGRMRDKVWLIRKQCISGIARIYRQLMSSSFSSGGALNSTSLKKLQWIPTKILHSYYRDSAEDKLCVERCLLSCIVPVNLPNPERMERMIRVYSSMDDENAVRALDALLLSRHRVRLYLRKLIETQQSTDLKGDEKKQSLLTQMVQMARHLPDPSKCRAHLDYLMESLNEEKLRESLLKSIDTSLSCEEVLKAKMDVVERFKSKVGLDTVRSLLDRACPMLIDANCIKLLVWKVCSGLCGSEEEEEDDEEEQFLRAKKALHLLRNLAAIMPGNFRATEVSEKLVALLESKDKEIVRLVLRILTLAGEHINKKTAGCLQPNLMQLAQEGDPDFTKDVVRCMHNVFGEVKTVMEQLYSSLVRRLDYEDHNLPAVLISLAQVARLQPRIFDSKQKSVVKDFVVKKLMLMDRAENEFVAGSPEWAPDDEISHETKMKVLGMKLLVEWLLGLASIASKAELKHKVDPVLKLLDSTLNHDGDLQAQDNISTCDRSRLRIAAACGLVKLAKSSAIREFISVPIFQTLALVVQDTCEEVREKLLGKLHKGLQNMQLPLWYLSIMVYVGTEPSKLLRNKFRKVISANAMKRRQYMSVNSKAAENSHCILPEYAMSYAVYLVAHHPQFSRTDTQELDKFKECLWFFLEPIVIRGQSYDFLLKLLDTIKLTVDAQDPKNPEVTKNLYSACDLAMGVMEGKLRHLKLGTFSGDLVLPDTLFRLKGESSRPNTNRYLPPEYNCTPSAKRVRGDEGGEYPKPAKSTKQASSSKPPTKLVEEAGKKRRKAPVQATKRSGRSKRAVSKPSPPLSEEEEEEENADVQAEGEEEDGGNKAGRKRKRAPAQGTRRLKSKRVLSDPPEDNTDVEEAEEEEWSGGKAEKKQKKAPVRGAARKTRSKVAHGALSEKEQAEEVEESGKRAPARVTRKTRSKDIPSDPPPSQEDTEMEQEESGSKAGRKRKGRATRKTQADPLSGEDTELEQAEEEEHGSKAGRNRKGRATRKTQADPLPHLSGEDTELEQAEEEEERGDKVGRKGRATRKTKAGPPQSEDTELEQAEEEEERGDKVGRKGRATGKTKADLQDTELEAEEEEECGGKVGKKRRATRKTKAGPPPPTLSEEDTAMEQTEEEEESRGKAGRKRKETPVRATRNTRAKGGPSDPPPLSGEDNTDETEEEGNVAGDHEDEEDQTPEEKRPKVVEDSTEEPASKIKRRATRRRR